MGQHTRRKNVVNPCPTGGLAPPPGDQPVWLAAAIFATALITAALGIPHPEEFHFAETEFRLQILPAEFSEATLPPSGNPDEVTLTQLPDGRVAAAWSATASDEAGVRSIWYSVLASGIWQTPRTIASRASTAAGTFTHAGSPGSPQLFAEGGWLHLWYSSPDGIAGDSLNHSLSTDAGQSWHKPEKIQVAPLAAGSLQILPARALSDGGLLLPLQHEGIGKPPEGLRLSATGKVVDKLRWPVDAWASFPSDEQAVATLRLSDTCLLILSRNNDPPGVLHFWRSDNAGRQWQKLHLPAPLLSRLDARKHAALLRTRDGRIHLAAVGGDGLIHHHVFTEAWLDGEKP